ncbi:MAG: BCD family MFS transporter [Anaerolineales bacterium]|jgi:BCD family chlorophyll transporter-like MFS transporter
MLRKQIQLGFIHVAVAMTLVPINSTLNRVMIKELAISATLVAIMASLPYLLSPIQVAIGSYSDRHPILRRYRTPYILIGLLLCVAGVAIAPQIAFLIAEDFWLGLLIGILAFGAWGMGYNFAAVSYLSLASELSGEKERGRTIAVMWFMMITGIILTAVILSRLVDPYSPAALQRAFWIVGAAALVLGLLGLVNLESRSIKKRSGEVRYSWNTMIQTIWGNPHARLFFWYLIILLAALLGQDILLEPFAAEAFQMSVRETTRITSFWGIFVLAAILLTGWLETRLAKRTLAVWGGWVAFLGFLLIVFSGVFLNQAIFFSGVVLLGAGTGISTVSNLALMLDMTVAGQVGLFIGAWGMANAISRLVGSVLGGIGRDLITQVSGNSILGYLVVFGVMAGFMLISLAMLARIDINAFRKEERKVSVVERAAMSSDA